MTHFYILKSVLLNIMITALLIGQLPFMVYFGCHGAWHSFFVCLLIQFFCWVANVILFLGAYGFVDKTPAYMCAHNILGEINYFRKRGYKIESVLCDDSLRPGFLMKKTGMPDIELHYNIPFFMWQYSSILIKFDNKSNYYKYDCGPDMKKFAKEFDGIFGPADPTISDIEEKGILSEQVCQLMERKKERQ